MADKRQFVDVWIVESETVYREVPYTVVTDWIQEGRLLEDDMLRVSGTTEWSRLATLPAFQAFLPRSEPNRAQDQAEALESVRLDFGWKPAHDEEDDDVDMIPLIDVSLVLLIFFMMTATVASGVTGISLPVAYNGIEISGGPVWVGVRQDHNGVPSYSMGQGPAPFPGDDNIASMDELMRRLDMVLEAGPVNTVLIRADKEIKVGTLKPVRAALEVRRQSRRVQIGDEVSERSSR